MTLYTRCAPRIAHAQIHRTQWRRTWPRASSIKPQTEPEWFRALREEMINREFPPSSNTITEEQELKICNTLPLSIPEGWTPRQEASAARSTIRPGHHLAYFNPAIAPEELLPDGTDALHSPGDPFVRRMWAGGSLQFDVDKYFARRAAWSLNERFLCSERIKDVQLRGWNGNTKVFVTIERRFANLQAIPRAISTLFPQNAQHGQQVTIDESFQRQETGDGRGDASLIEERNLVFMKERSLAERAAIQEGKLAPTRYLKSPGQPDFSYSFKPTPSLLSQYSALTFNAHAIHLDREYARDVEGHRNLLVHGPLCVNLMLNLMTNHLRTMSGTPHTIQSIEYRNHVPLYCNEELRVCGKTKVAHDADNGVYDVWIEGPTGGMAVKGVIYAAPIPR